MPVAMQPSKPVTTVGNAMTNSWQQPVSAVNAPVPQATVPAGRNATLPNMAGGLYTGTNFRKGIGTTSPGLPMIFNSNVDPNEPAPASPNGWQPGALSSSWWINAPGTYYNPNLRYGESTAGNLYGMIPEYNEQGQFIGFQDTARNRWGQAMGTISPVSAGMVKHGAKQGFGSAISKNPAKIGESLAGTLGYYQNMLTELQAKQAGYESNGLTNSWEYKQANLPRRIARMQELIAHYQQQQQVLNIETGAGSQSSGVSSPVSGQAVNWRMR